jgi:putative transposase
MHLPHLSAFDAHPLYFMTACTHGRRAILANTHAAETLKSVWARSATIDGWYVGRYVIMPDHVHLFVRPEQNAIRRADWLKSWKSITSRLLKHAAGQPGPLWQPDTFDHIVRSTSSYTEKWEYVRNNPVRKGLCNTPSEWPWQGEIHELKY